MDTRVDGGAGKNSVVKYDMIGKRRCIGVFSLNELFPTSGNLCTTVAPNCHAGLQLHRF